MIIQLKIIHTFSEHYTTGKLSNAYSSFWHISHFRRTSILSQWALQTRQAAEYTARWTQAIGGGICKISLLLERRLCQSFVHPTRPTWPIFQATSIPEHSISRSMIFEKISAPHLNSVPGFLFGWSPVSRQVLKIMTRYSIPWLEKWCPHSRILTSLALAWNWIVMIDSRDNVILLWLPWSGIIPNLLLLLKSHMAYAWCVKFLKVRRWGIQLFDYLITQEISMFTWRFWTKLILIFCTLFATALEYAEVLRSKKNNAEGVSKEWWYGKAEMLGDIEEVMRWWRYNLVWYGTGLRCCNIRWYGMVVLIRSWVVGV